MCLIEDYTKVLGWARIVSRTPALPILRKAFKKFFIYGVGIQSSLLAEDY